MIWAVPSTVAHIQTDRAVSMICATPNSITCARSARCSRRPGVTANLRFIKSQPVVTDPTVAACDTAATMLPIGFGDFRGYPPRDAGARGDLSPDFTFASDVTTLTSHATPPRPSTRL